MPSITITTANICGLPLRPKWAVRKRMRRALLQPGAVFGQEVAKTNRWASNDYSTMWHRVAARLGKVTAGGPHEVPISTPKDWTIDGSEVVLAHAGRKYVSPNRYITVVRAQVDGQRVAFANCHTVSKPRQGVPASAWRIAQWDTYVGRLGQIVSDLHAQGYTVIYGGDMNKAKVPVVHPEQTTLIGSGLDHLWCVAAQGVSVQVTKRTAIGRTVLMDHPILTATITLGATR